MDCITNKCNHKATLAVRIGIVDIYICESCGRKFGISDHGQASQKEITELQNEQFEQIMNTGAYRPLKRELIRVKQKGNIKMLNPMHEREGTFTSHCHLRARG